MAERRTKKRNGKLAAEFQLWIREAAGDNSDQHERLLRNLRLAIERDLSPRQRQTIEMYYLQHMTMPVIAKELGVSASTVSRTLIRAKEKLYKFLKYSL